MKTTVKPRRNICDVIGACCAIAPELTEPLNAIYQRATERATERAVRSR